jgi:hypothetical protein
MVALGGDASGVGNPTVHDAQVSVGAGCGVRRTPRLRKEGRRGEFGGEREGPAKRKWKINNGVGRDDASVDISV